MAFLIKLIAFVLALIGMSCLSVSDFVFSFFGKPTLYHFLAILAMDSLVCLISVKHDMLKKTINYLHSRSYGWLVKAIISSCILLLMTIFMVGLKVHDLKMHENKRAIQELFTLFITKDESNIVKESIFGVHLSFFAMRMCNVVGSISLAILSVCISKQIQSVYEFGVMMMLLELAMHGAAEIHLWIMIGTFLASFVIIAFSCYLEEKEVDIPPALVVPTSFSSAVLGVVLIGISDFIHSFFGKPTIYHFMIIPASASILGTISVTVNGLRKYFENIHTKSYGWFVKAFVSSFLLIFITLFLIGLEIHDLKMHGVKDPIARGFGLGKNDFGQIEEMVYGAKLTLLFMKVMNLVGSGAFAAWALCMSREIKSGFEYGVMCSFLELLMHGAIELNIWWVMIIAWVYSFGLLSYRSFLEYVDTKESDDIIIIP